MIELHPVAILLLGMTTVVGLIVALRVNAFLALITAALLVSLLAPGEPATRISRVAEAFGAAAGGVGIVIALAAIIGSALMGSGAADRVVRSITTLVGQERGAAVLLASGFLLSVSVFFDTVFFLLIPLAMSMYRRTGHRYLRYVMALSAGAAVTHTLVPPTPGPLVVADALGVELGVMVLVGALVALPAAAVGLLFAAWADRRMPVRPEPPPEEIPHETPGSPPATSRPPGLLASLLPVLLPVALVSAHTVAGATAPEGGAGARLIPYLAVLGNANLALLIAAAAAMWLYRRQRGASAREMSGMVEQALTGAGVVILITSAGGAFGAMLRAAQIGPAIESAFTGAAGASDRTLLLLAFAVASLLKIAQGSSTVAMITTSAMLSALIPAAGALSYHPVYIATAIASGSLVGSWMNDSGFWIYTKLGGFTTTQALRTWTPLLALLGLTGMVTTVLLSVLMPMG